MRYFLQSALLLLLLGSGSAISATTLFDGNDLINVELAGPLSTLMESPESREELPFQLRACDSEIDIKVRLRGKSRLRVCDFLPMRLNFGKDEAGGTPFDGLDKVKLVVPCSYKERDEKNLIEEFLVYRVFNLLSPASYQVRLLRITFLDTDHPTSKRNGTRYAFIIEPASHVARRLGGEVAEVPGIALSWLEQRQAALVFVFQYLVGNTDWSLVSPLDDANCCHNGTLVKRDEKILYVPYDFDLTGFVDAPYAKPDAQLRIRSVRQRRYRGFCMDQAALGEALDYVRARQASMYELVDAAPLLSDKDKQSDIAYLDKFFKSAERPDKLLKTFEKGCLE